MNLTELVAYIGKSRNGEIDNPLEPIIKNDIKTPKEDENYYVVDMIFDIDEGFIDFKLNSRFSDQSAYKYNYFGNNSRASTQFYLTREVNNLKYLFKSTFSDLYMMLEKESLADGELGKALKKLEDMKFINIVPRNGKGSLNLGLLKVVKKNFIIKYELDEKGIKLDDKKYNFESLIRLFLNDQNKKDKFVMVVPAVKVNGQIKYLCNMDDYTKLVIKYHYPKKSKKSASSAGNDKTCYICGKRKSDVSSAYKFEDKWCINKLFTTTYKNNSRFDQNLNYDDVYSICKNCFENLQNGGKIVLNKFHAKIADEDVFIIPEAIMGKFDYNYIYNLKSNVDFMFNSSKIEDTLQIIEGSAHDYSIQNYSLNFVFYRANGKSFNVLETIEDVPVLRFDKIINAFYKSTKKLDGLIGRMNIGDIYRIIPVRQDKKHKQINIGRVLSIYKSIFQGDKIDYNILFSYACEAFEKGLSQLRKSEINNYFNMGLSNYKKYPNFDDLFIKRIAMSYLVFINCCQDMDLLNNRVFNVYEGDDYMNEFVSTSDDVNSNISKIEDFLNHQGFGNRAKALFYLGTLIYWVAMAQVENDHPNKPILKKIQFQGMKNSEIFRLYNDTVEKLRQYQKIILPNEVLMNRFHNYYGDLNQKTLSEQENVFYIMAGYSYMVGSRHADAKPKQ